MAIISRKVIFTSAIDEVWNVITSCDEYSWRSDLSRIEVIKDQKQFVEHTREGYQTTFTITAFEPHKRYEFDMENENMSGHWTGIFSAENGMTCLELTETVNAKKILMKPFVRTYLKKQQEIYLRDLKKALGEDDQKHHS